jgi:hypothetical protein
VVFVCLCVPVYVVFYRGYDGLWGVIVFVPPKYITDITIGP